MNIKESEKELFKRWKLRRPNLVTDGVVEEGAYLASSPKILLVLKEVNDEKGGWDLCEFVRDGGRSQTWGPVSHWVTGIAALPRDTPWDAVNEATDATLRMALRSIAIMNLKKTPGGSSSNQDEIGTFARADSDLLAEQFRLYGADLVICCGEMVGDLVDEVLRLDPERAWQKTTRGWWFKEYVDAKFVVSYLHPQIRIYRNLVFYGLMDAIREIRHGSS